jgi:hypothetical protein
MDDSIVRLVANSLASAGFGRFLSLSLSLSLSVSVSVSVCLSLLSLL